MLFGGSTSMTTPWNETWITLGDFLQSLFFALSACWRACGTLVLCQYPTLSNNFLICTPAKAIWKPTRMLHMLHLAHTSNRAFKLVSIMFRVGRLILLSQTHTHQHTSWLEGKIKSNNYNIFLVLMMQSCCATFLLIFACGSAGSGKPWRLWDNGGRHDWWVQGSLL